MILRHSLAHHRPRHRPHAFAGLGDADEIDDPPLAAIDLELLREVGELRFFRGGQPELAAPSG